MANQKQCEYCNKYKRGPYGMKCSWYGRKPSFDSSECPHFEKKEYTDSNARFEKGKEKEQQPLTSTDDAYRYALMSLKDRKTPTSQVIKELVQRGFPESESETLVLKIAKDLNEKALVPIFMGIMIFIGAIVLTITSIKDVGNGMQRITIYFGFMLLGIVIFGKGLSNRCKIK